MKRNKKLKTVLISVTAAVLAVAISLGCWAYFGRRSTDPVAVYPFANVGVTEYWGDSKETYGPVSTDKIQTVYLSNTQTVTEILVQQGDTVKKGDVLMTFDTTLTDLELERKRLGVEKLKLQLESDKERLAEIQAMKPMVIPDVKPTEPTEPDEGTELLDPYRLVGDQKLDGTTMESALICWLRSDTALDQTLLDQLFRTAEDRRSAAKPTEPTEPSDGTEPSEPETAETCYLIIKVTDRNLSKTSNLTWQGLLVTRTAQGTSFRFEDASGVSDPTAQQPVEPDEPDIDIGSGYTAAQIAQMRSEQEKTIRDDEYQIKMAESNYKIMQAEAGDGKVTAKIDGTVVSVLTPEEAKANSQPLLKVSSGGGFYVEGQVSELDKDTMAIGQTVTVNDWNTGNTYTGTVQSIGENPVTSNSYGGDGNPNVSYYPFRVFVDGDADMMEGNYVSIQYSAAEEQNGIYLENPFLLTESDGSYVYVKGADGTLEKRAVTTGRYLWGSYTEIRSGLSAEDEVAFPYGKNVFPGAKTTEGDLSDLYNY